jgi:8-oxo-dGTP pyrophosphatase MutT (NUDIX family)
MEMERWDIYDKNKVRTGRTMERNHFNLADDEYHLTVLGVIRRPDGRFLITKRVMTKAWAPGWWEVSGGAAQAGEESEEAVRREVLEETGLDVKEAEGGYVFTYHRELFRRCLSLHDGCYGTRCPSADGRNRRMSVCYTRRDQETRRSGNFPAL